MSTFSDLLYAFYTRTPDQTAIVVQHAGQPDRPLSYRALLEKAAAYAEAYQNQGVQPGEVVILILQHGVDLIGAFYGAVLHGAIPSIMPFLTEKLLPERYRADLAALISVTKPAAIVTYPEFEPEVRAALQEGDSVRAVIVSNTVAEAAAPDFTRLGGMRRKPEDIVLLQHSSGTTGLQKGVALSHQAVLHQLNHYREALQLTPDDVIVSWLPLYHDMGLIAGFLMPVLWGNPLVLMSPFDWVRAPQRLLQAVSQYHGTISWLPNFAYNFCAQKVRARHLEGVDLSSWRAVINCSEPVRPESHEAFVRAFAPYGLRSSAPAVCYAMAENVFAVTQTPFHSAPTVEKINREALQVERVARLALDNQPFVSMMSCGKPIPGTEVRILLEDGREAEERQVGEVALHSDCMLTGYYHRTDATHKAFRDGWYLTGDYGYLAGGELYVAGRKKDLIIVGGKNIYPQDLELLAMEVPAFMPGAQSLLAFLMRRRGLKRWCWRLKWKRSIQPSANGLRKKCVSM